jgi:hypothetical protein
MKALATATLCFFATLSANAQYDPEMNREEKQVYQDHLKQNGEHWKEQGIRSKTTYVMKGNDSIISSHFEFDREGRTIESIFYRKNGKEKEHWTFTYDNQGRMTSNHKTRNSRDLSGAAWTYIGTNPDPVEILWKGKKGKVHTRVVREYDASENLIMASSFYGKNLTKKGWKFEYDYYENGSTKQARYYNPKGKLKQVYTYDCNQVPKTKKEVLNDTTQKCIKYETDAEGNKTKIIEELDEKGRLAVTRLTFNKQGWLIASIKTENGKVKTEEKWEANEAGWVLSMTGKYKKGLRTITKSFKYTRDTEGNVLSVAGVENNKDKRYVNAYSKF